MSFFWWKNKKQNESRMSAVPSSARLFEYLGGYINRPDLYEKCLVGKKKDDILSGNVNDAIRSYYCTEKFITENKPLIVKEEITKEALRERLCKQDFFASLPAEIKVIFECAPWQFVSVFNVGFRPFLDFAVSNFGIQKIAEEIDRLSEVDPLVKKLTISGNTVLFSKEERDATDLGFADGSKFAIKTFLSRLSFECSRIFGVKVVSDIFSKMYAELREIYDEKIVDQFLLLVPDGYLDKEKISILGREELEKKLRSSIEVETEKSRNLADLNERLNKAVSELNQNKAAILNLLEDVSAEKGKIEIEVDRRTKELQEEQTKLKYTMASLPFAFFITDPELNILDYNDRTKLLFREEEEIAFGYVEKWMAPKINLKENCLRAIESREMVVNEEAFINGRYYKITVIPIMHGVKSELVLGVLCIIDDITERKVLERSRDEFFSIASHELRTPLTAIMGNASMILEFFTATIPNKEVEQMVGDIYEAGTKLIKIVNEFLDVSRLETGKVVFKREKFDMKEMVVSAIREFEAVAIKRSLVLELKPTASEDFTIEGDKTRTRQILDNLISNALNYTNAGGVRLELSREGGRVVVRVIDTGVGISKENQTLLFRKFQQAQGDILTKNVTQSTGLGLYISKLIAEAMGAKLELESSEVGKGTTFKLSLVQKI